MSSRQWILSVLLLGGILLVGCRGQTTPAAPAISSDVIRTEAAQTVIARLTLEAPTLAVMTPVEAGSKIAATATISKPIEPPPTHTPEPTLPPPPTPTLPPPPTATPVPTITIPVTPVAGEAITAEPLPGYVVSYQDEFRGKGGWAEGSTGEVSLSYGGGGYRIAVHVLNDAAWSIREQPYRDLSIEVDATQVEGPRDGYYGVICRYQDGSNFYGLIVGADGQYGIFKKAGGLLKFIQQSVEPSPYVITGPKAINHIRGDCVGNMLTLFVNGYQLAQVQDSDFTSGSIGLTAGTRKTPDFVAWFSNLVIWTP